ncbi:MAG: STAS domain-containing protein [Acidobacteria bacterium]|nr:STAS domain-containing protein [Acidobacteriota bacterium]
MGLSIEQREREDIVILDIRGRLTVGEEASQLREVIRRLVEGRSNRIILNLAEVDYIDSTGLGALVVCYTSVKKSGGALKVLNLSERNIELLVLTKLSTVFEIFTDEQDAVNSFFPNREVKRFDVLSFVQQQESQEK